MAKTKKSDKTTSDEYVEEPKSSFNEGRRVKWCSYFESSAVPQMIKDNYHMIQQSIPRYIVKRHKNICTHKHTHG